MRHIAPDMVKLPCGLLIAQANEGGGGGERRHDMPTLEGDQWPFFLPFKSSRVHLEAKKKRGLVDARVGRDDIGGARLGRRWLDRQSYCRHGHVSQR